MLIRQNGNDLFAVRKSVIATLMHNTYYDDAETRHRYYSKKQIVGVNIRKTI